MLRGLIRPAIGRCRLQVRGVDLARDRLPFLPHAPVMVDAEITADADDPGLKVRAPIETAKRLENLAPVLPDDQLPRRLIAGQTLLDQAVGRSRLSSRRINGHAIGESYQGSRFLGSSPVVLGFQRSSGPKRVPPFSRSPVKVCLWLSSTSGSALLT